jgi:hypothetical protein
MQARRQTVGRIEKAAGTSVSGSLIPGKGMKMRMSDINGGPDGLGLGKSDTENVDPNLGAVAAVSSTTRLCLTDAMTQRKMRTAPT